MDRPLKAFTRMPLVDNSITQFSGIDHQALMNAHPITGEAPGVDTSPIGTSSVKNEWGQPNYGYIAGSQAVQGIMAYLRNKRKEKDFRDYDRTQQNPLLQIPTNPNTTDVSQYGETLLKKGGWSSSKKNKYKKEYGGEIEDELERDIFAEPVQQNVEETQDTEQVYQSAQADEEFFSFIPSASRADLEAYSRTGRGTSQLSDINSFKSNIARSEGAGYFDPTGIKNEKGEPASSAFGKYQFIKDTRQAVRSKFFPYMGKEEFENKYKSSPQFQEQVMDKYSGYLLNKYQDPSVAATAFFLGEGKANAKRSHNPGNGNMSLGQYLTRAGYAKGGSVYDLLESQGKDGSYKARKKEYGHLFKEGYRGTAEQNNRLYEMIEGNQATLPESIVGKELPSVVPDVQQPVQQPGQWGSVPDYVVDTTQRNTVIKEDWHLPGMPRPDTTTSDTARIAPAMVPDPNIGALRPKPPKPAVSKSSQPQARRKIENVPISVLPPSDPLDYELTDFSGTTPVRNRVRSKGRLESGVVVDKGTNMAHLIKDYKVQRTFPVLTGKNPDRNASDQFSMDQLERDPSLRNTPTGYYKMRKTSNPGLLKEYESNIVMLDPINDPVTGVKTPANSMVGMHQTYHPWERDKFYGTNDAWQSYGCVNCKKPDIKDVMQQFPQGDTVRVIDSRKGMPVFAGGGPTEGDPTKPKLGQVYRDDFYEGSAQLTYHKNEILNPLLRGKNPKAYDDYFGGMKGLNDADRDAYIENTPYNEYLSPEEIRGALGDEYPKYINAVRTVNRYMPQQGKKPLYGTVEGKDDLETLNFGRRFASLRTTPTLESTVKASNTKLTTTGGLGVEQNQAADRTYKRTYTYDPQTGVQFTEEGDLTAMPNFVRPRQKPPAGTASMKKGGLAQYKEGGFYYMTNEQIKELKRQGYEIE